MKIYEAMLIIRPALSKEEVEEAVAKIGEIITKEDGEMVRIDQWGKRKLAYPIGKERTGYYVLLYFKGRGQLVSKLENSLNISDSVLRYMTLQVEPSVLEQEIKRPAELRPLDEEAMVTLAKRPSEEPETPEVELDEETEEEGLLTDEKEEAEKKEAGEEEAGEEEAGEEEAVEEEAVEEEEREFPTEEDLDDEEEFEGDVENAYEESEEEEPRSVGEEDSE